tara:strand:+ start:7327 stop:8094 length:768 start_codon:yes stop_codon:yes gene_type:complete
MQNYKYIFLVGNNFLNLFKKIKLENHLVIVSDSKLFLDTELKNKYKLLLGKKVIFLKTYELEKKFKKIKSDYLISLSWRNLISSKILDKIKIAINIHPALLPYYKGYHPLPDVIKNKEKYHGITAHLITNKIDEGDIILQKKFRINRFSTIQSLQYIFDKNIIKFLREVLDILSKKSIQNHAFKIQNYKTKYFAKKRTPKDSEIKNIASLNDLFDFVRSCHSSRYPAFFKINNQKIYIKLSRNIERRKKNNPHDI